MLKRIFCSLVTASWLSKHANFVKMLQRKEWKVVTTYELIFFIFIHISHAFFFFFPERELSV